MDDDQEQGDYEAKDPKQGTRGSHEHLRTAQSVLRKIVQNLLIFGIRRSECIIAW